METPLMQERDELTLVKVRKGVQRTISIIAKVDGKRVQDVTDEALLEYIQRRGLVISIDTAPSMPHATSPS